MADVFLSYAHEDRERARALVQVLESKGWSVWWDRDIEPGSSFHRVITHAIAQAKCVVVCWSEHSVNSDWVANEANEGKERGILVPVLLDAARPPLGFRMDHAVSLAGWTSGASDPELDSLLDTVTRHVERVGAGAMHAVAAADAGAQSVRPPAPTTSGLIGRGAPKEAERAG